MDRILIISFFFPPCNLTASERVASWARHLSKFGYYPVVVSRRWDHPIKQLADMSIGTPEEVLYEKQEHFESYLVPYIPTIKDNIYSRYGDSKMVLLRRGLSMLELLLQRDINYFIPFNNIGAFADEFISKNQDIKKVLISGNPHILYKFGYQLQKKHEIKWIADYRDAWSTSEIDLIARGALFKYLRYTDSYYEKKWVGTAAAVTSVSEPLLKRISEFVKVPGKWISNGFEQGEFNDITAMDRGFEKFTVTYIGTLYPGQQIEIFCEAFKQLVDEVKSPRLQLLFPGLAFHADQDARIKKAMQGYESFVSCTERCAKEKILEIELNSHLLFYPAWKGFDGIIPSKIYEYISSGTYTLVVPSDHGEVEKIITQSGCGAVANSTQEAYIFLKKAYDLFLQGKKLTSDLSPENSYFFSREHQAKRLADLLDVI